MLVVNCVHCVVSRWRWCLWSLRFCRETTACPSWTALTKVRFRGRFFSKRTGMRQNYSQLKPSSQQKCFRLNHRVKTPECSRSELLEEGWPLIRSHTEHSPYLFMTLLDYSEFICLRGSSSFHLFNLWSRSDDEQILFVLLVFHCT